MSDNIQEITNSTTITETENSNFKHYDIIYSSDEKHFEFNVYNPKLIQILDFLKNIVEYYECRFDAFKLYSIPDIIRILLKGIFDVGFSGNNYSNFVIDIDNISDEELAIMLAALLNI